MANPNLTVPGYQQHLGQSMLGAYDVPPDLCPGSMHLMQCRVVGSLQACNRALCEAGLRVCLPAVSHSNVPSCSMTCLLCTSACLV